MTDAPQGEPRRDALDVLLRSFARDDLLGGPLRTLHITDGAEPTPVTAPGLDVTARAADDALDAGETDARFDLVVVSDLDSRRRPLVVGAALGACTGGGTVVLLARVVPEPGAPLDRSGGAQQVVDDLAQVAVNRAVLTHLEAAARDEDAVHRHLLVALRTLGGTS